MSKFLSAIAALITAVATLITALALTGIFSPKKTTPPKVPPKPTIVHPGKLTLPVGTPPVVAPTK